MRDLRVDLPMGWKGRSSLPLPVRSSYGQPAYESVRFCQIPAESCLTAIGHFCRKSAVEGSAKKAVWMREGDSFFLEQWHRTARLCSATSIGRSRSMIGVGDLVMSCR